MSATFPFNCDLVHDSLLHLDFLRKIHRVGVSLRALPFESLHRYRDLWLPLVFRNPTGGLVPPPDIAWLWHCHRLAPCEYLGYLERRFGSGTILEALPPFAVQTVEERTLKMTSSLVTRVLWNEAYGEEPFFLSHSRNMPDSYKEVDLYVGGFDLISSTRRQAYFLWQVSGEVFSDMAFLRRGRDNYLRFLKIGNKAEVRGLTLVPTFQIDLMWHTHILSSIAMYNEDCKAITGRIFRHDDSQGDKTLSGVLDASFRGTNQLWKEVYHEEYAVPGGMYRGEPPTAFFHSNWIAQKQLHDSRIQHLLLPKLIPSSATGDHLLQNWTCANGVTTDGSPAFIKVEANSQQDLKDLQERDDYILGFSDSHGLGYYHLETRESNIIIEQRMASHCKSIESGMAMKRSCCGNHESIAPQEAELIDALELYKEMHAQSMANCPSGVVGSVEKAKTLITGDSDLYTESGIWLYPPDIWNSSGGDCDGPGD